MKTGCFNWYKEKNGVAICLRPPVSYKGERFKELSPPLKTFIAIKNNKINHQQYEYEYRNLILSKLDPIEIYHMFDGKVLLCWEEPLFDASTNNIVNSGTGFCHRHIVSSWIFESLGVRIEEWRKNEKSSPSIKLF